MSNFLENLVIPQLGSPTFQNDFEAFCSVIKNNFERLVSVQFTKGNDGNSVVAQKILIGDGLTETDTMPNLVYQIVKSIYKLEGDTPITIGDFKQALEGTYNIFGDPDNGGIAPSFYDAYSFPELQDLSNETQTTTGFYIDIVLDEHNGKAYMAVPYIFIDGRISELSRYKREHADDDIYKTFHDWSTAVFGEGEFVSNVQDIQDWNWETNSMDIVPKLYFDPNIGEFCWEVNGQQTSVTAQGVKGNDGIASNVYMARGNRTGNNISIESIQFVDDEGNIKWLPITEKLEDVENYINGVKTVIKSVKCSEGQDSIILRDTDFLLVFYNGENPNQNPDENPPQNSEFEYRWAFFGKPHMNSNNSEVIVYCEQDKSDDIFLAILNQDFRNDLNGIYNSSDPSALRGLFIPGRKSSQADEDPSYYHMTWSEDNGNDISKLHSAPVTPGNTHTPIDDPCNGYIGDWQVDYNMQVQGALGVQGNVTMKNDAYVQGNLNVQGNIEASSIKVTGNNFNSVPNVRPAVVSTFKNTKYTLTRKASPTNNTTPSNSGYVETQFGYEVDINTTLNLKMGMISNSYSGGTIDTSINKQMHKMVGRYGVQSAYWQDIESIQDYGYMWDTGLSADFWIEDDVQVVNEYNFLTNAPKLFDVIEYDIPIHIHKEIEDIAIFDETLSSIGQNNTIYLQGSNNSPWNIGICSSLWGVDKKFSDINCRILLQGVEAGNIDNYIKYTSNNGNSIDMDNADVFAQNINGVLSFGDDDTNYIGGTLNNIYRILTTHSSRNPYNSGFQFKGNFDYKGETYNYNLDFFINIQEIIGRINPGGLRVWNTHKSNVQLLVVPIGYIEDSNGFMSPIYGNTPIENHLPQQEYNYSSTFNSPILNGMINHQTTMQTNMYYDSNTGTYTGENQISTNIIDGGDSFLGIFEKLNTTDIYYEEQDPTADNRETWNDSTFPNTINLGGKYSDITNSMRVVDENLKVCPNNMEEGTWKNDNDEYYWISNKPVYPMIFSRNYYPNGQETNVYVIKILGIFDAKHPIVVDGLLTYPYGPALLTHFDEDTHDKYGQYYQDKYSPMPIGGTGKPFYHKQGKILGNTNSTTKGMVFVEDTTEP